MKWSWRIGTVAGIGIYVHATFLLILLWAGAVYYRETQSWAGVAWGVFVVMLMFGIVVLHELGHALTARRFDIKTRDITLLPIGGLARLERLPDKPIQEFFVAIAGPAVNVVLAIILGGILYLFGRPEVFVEIDQMTPGVVNLLVTLFWVNIVLAAFNMLPAFPMDGGRVVRSLLALRLDYVQATQIAASIGQFMAFIFGMLGIFFNPWLVLIAIFVWLGASAESSMAQIKGALGGIPVRNAMIREFHTLSPHDPLQRAIEHILAGFQQDFPVEEDGRLVGILTRSALINALAREGRSGTVADAMERNFETADPYELLEGAFARLQGCNCRSLPVVRDGRIVGILTMDNVGEFMMVQSALSEMPLPRVPQ